MRISEEMRQFFKYQILKKDPTAKVYLFGSRTDDSKKGGDIDILILSDKKWILDDIFNLKIQFYKTFGEQKLDIVNYEKNQNNPFKEYILKEAILL